MDRDLFITVAVLAATMFLFTREWLRLDVVALLSLLALLLAGILEPAEAIAGFSSSVVFIIAGLFVVGAALFRTGVADWIGGRVAGVAGTNPLRLTVVLMLVVAGLSAFMSSTGAVALFLPVAASLSRRASLSPSKLLLPISFASLLGGMLTLIGTPPNIVVSEQLTSRGEEPFGFFEFSPPGLLMLLMGVIFMATVGRRLLPDRAAASEEQGGPTQETVRALAERFGLPDNVDVVRVEAGSGLIGHSLAEPGPRTDYGISVLGIGPVGRHRIEIPDQEGSSHPRRFLEGDTLLIHGMPENRERVREELALRLLSDAETEKLSFSREAGFAEVLLPPRSRLIGSTLRKLGFREVHDLSVIAALRLGEAVTEPLADLRLRFGDSFLVEGPWRRIRALRRQPRDFVVLGEARGPGEDTRLSRQGGTALGVLVVMMALMTFGVLPTVTLVLGAALALVLLRCVSMEDSYHAMSWESLVVIAAMLPMASALRKTGGIEMAVTGLTDGLGAVGPLAVIAGLFVLTSLFSQFVSNTATAVLVAPIAFEAAVAMGVSERAFLMTVAIAASTAFATPIASPTNTLVLTPGGYRFGDYARVGIPLQLLILVATVLVVPVLFPL